MSQQTQSGETESTRKSTRQLENDIVSTITRAPVPARPWQEEGYAASRFIKAGLLIGILAGCISLICNIIGSVLWPAFSGVPQHPLRLIQVYLTFPLGRSAMDLNSGFTLAAGCILFLMTGAFYGMLFEWALSYFVPRIGLLGRATCCAVLAIVLWVVNFYGILLWLQPLLFQGRWVIDLVPWWVAAATHLVFGEAIALLYPLGEKRLQPLSTGPTRPISD